MEIHIPEEMVLILIQSPGHYSTPLSHLQLFDGSQVCGEEPTPLPSIFDAEGLLESRSALEAMQVVNENGIVLK